MITKRKALAGLLAAAAMTLAACGPTTSASSSSPNPDLAAAVSSAEAAAKAAADAAAGANAAQSAADAAAAKPSGNSWVYTDQKAALQDTPIKFACVESTDEVALSAPYQTQHLRLCLRRGGGIGYDAIIQLDEQGQFMCDFENCTVAARIDGGPIKHFGATSQGRDGSDDTMYITSGASVAAAIRHATKATFALQFFQAGTQEITFPVAGLDWPDGPAPARHHRG